MNFINPKTDFAFKKIFGSDDSKEILISFLNALLYEARPVIEDLEIIDPYLAPNIKGIKDTYLDVKAKINGDKTVIIEMQVLNVEYFQQRVLYNATKTYSMQLSTGSGYSKLNPVIALTITDFKMFENMDTVISHFIFKEKTFLVDYLADQFEMVFVELPKFNKELDELETLTDKWIYFMKTAQALQAVPEELGNVEELKQAFKIASTANLNAQELDELDKREIWIQDQRGSISLATKIALAEGIEQGIEQGKQQLQQLVVSLLERRVGPLSPEIQTRISQLSAEQLENLGEAVLDLASVSDLTDRLQTYSRSR
ncbi:MAG: Rpn family recombination-promoting nuclease/putative transposase [Microcoleus sp. PH2017_10_PVI_O_A]|uniref:Rpn family recombination-promoting nuclease/putative transposase n=1 Tax=unclassified Microcoleus TaxID=2642155 RepID=UPI001DA5EB80|nr:MULTISPECIES: Rpn family recombination-promoting nuclease/putative transposase [unclassified Microcoleus]TAE78514.1 MAG: Rpn family recombination-promoting nuclease/putative transposase [Oscillatoriales cyanobacterium]MCC3408192.1 Rpn family recombination-promoting nuclease/putative transposase [Microcoleus sp. PH2017_10_PVI_O_A]MCC3462882.1 Rpn family recombination-promoting nuclease/putative transposase [Microcoleus sp. PH2017_11_PCY_U_A]MCC3480737.1 Rpn family recombination-promoting nucl